MLFRSDEFYILSDSNEINNIFNTFNFKKGKIYNRSDENAQDDSSTEDAVIEFLESKKINRNSNLILCQATSPYLNEKDIDNAINLFEESKFNSLLSVVDFKRFIWNKNGNSVNYNYKDRPRRQDADQYFLENGALYVSKVQLIKKNSNRLSNPIGYYVMNESDYYELDEIEDWEKSEFLFNNKSNKNKNDISKKLKL